jgi:hypothetical protein
MEELKMINKLIHLFYYWIKRRVSEHEKTEIRKNGYVYFTDTGLKVKGVLSSCQKVR